MAAAHTIACASARTTRQMARGYITILLQSNAAYRILSLNVRMGF